MQNAEHLNMTS